MATEAIKTFREIKELKERFKNKGDSFTFRVSGSSIKIEHPILGKFFYTKTNMNPNEFWFVNKVKKHVNNNVDLGKYPNLGASDVRYIHIRHDIQAINNRSHILEFDLNAAYWNAALDLGIITEEIYLEGLEVEKMTRLITAGSWAKNVTIYEVENGIEKRVTNEKAKTSHLFFNLVDHVYKMIFTDVWEQFGDKIYFFWVDAFFVKYSARKQMIEFFEDNGIAYKEKDIFDTKIKDKVLYMTEAYKGAKKSKKFMLPLFDIRNDFINLTLK